MSETKGIQPADIDIVQFAVWPANNELTDGQQVQAQMSEVAKKTLRQYGVQYKEEDITGHGGDGWTLLMILKELWQVKEYLSIPLVAIRWANQLFKYRVLKLTYKDKDYTVPRASIHLTIRVDKFDSHIYPYAIDRDTRVRVTTLLLLAENIRSALKSKFELYRYDIVVIFVVKNLKYKVTFEIDDESNNKITRVRNIKQANELCVYDNKDLTFKVSKYNWLVRKVKPLTVNNNGLIAMYLERTYYSYFSTKMIGDYFRTSHSKTAIKKANKPKG